MCTLGTPRSASSHDDDEEAEEEEVEEDVGALPAPRARQSVTLGKVPTADGWKKNLRPRWPSLRRVEELLVLELALFSFFVWLLWRESLHAKEMQNEWLQLLAGALFPHPPSTPLIEHIV
jgi:hypothetical protein